MGEVYRLRRRRHPDVLGRRVTPDAAAALRVAGHEAWQQLDRDVALEAGVAGAVDFAHPAGAERREDLVRADTCAGRQHERRALDATTDETSCAAADYSSGCGAGGQRWRLAHNGSSANFRGAAAGQQGANRSYPLRVPVGTYTLQVDVPDGLLAPRSRTVEVRDPRGCAQADVGIRSNGRLAGRLLTARGEPMAQTSIMLYQFQASPQVPGRPPREPFLTSRDYAMTDATGAFEFSGMAAGSYVVGVLELGERTPANTRGPLLYPGTTDPAAATAVTITHRAATVMDDYVLPASIVLVRGVVRAIDGRPLPDIPVLLLTLEDAAVWRHEGWLHSRSDGTFEFTAHTGRHYRIVAGRDVGRYEDVRLPPDPSRRPRAETPIFEATTDLSTIELLLPD
jgi:hypothetical protein